MNGRRDAVGEKCCAKESDIQNGSHGNLLSALKGG
jgi:hypothetical protein